MYRSCPTQGRYFFFSSGPEQGQIHFDKRVASFLDFYLKTKLQPSQGAVS